MSKDVEKIEYGTGPWDTPVSDEEYTLEEILAEYGSSRQQKIMEEVERETAQPEPEATFFLSLEELVGTTVGAVMEEHHETLLKPKRGLFSRKRQEETEEFYDPMEMPAEPVKPLTEAERIGEEPEPSEVASEERETYKSRRRPLNGALLAALAPLAAMTAERYGVTVPYWTGDRQIQGVVMLACLLIGMVLCWQVPVYALRKLSEKRCVSALAVSLAVLAAAADCALWLFVPERGEPMPYTAAAGLALLFTQWGISRESRGSYDSFRLASLDDHPPYLVTETPRGACKQRGDLRGFYTTAMRDDYASRLQTVFLPLIFMAALVFAGLTSLGRGRGIDFLRNWSAILTAAATCSLPLCWGLPWSRLTRRQQKSGCAVAGWDGAARVGKRRGMILTDTDLFPPGTIRLNGVKVYGEELGKASSYAAAAARAAGCGLERVFEGLAVGENAPRETAQDLSFYEQGGFGCTIRGESVLLGTASFLRKQNVRLPSNINLKTGIFLAIDHQLAAVFAVKYEASENVDYALRTLRRSRITPILAVRDPNITPALLNRKFSKKVKAEFPELTDRVALSEAEEDRGLPRALLLREGLLPYAEAVVGSRRLRTAVCRVSWLSIMGSAAGVLLTAYLVSLEKFDLLTPLSLTVFLLLWTLPVLLMSDWTGRY